MAHSSALPLCDLVSMNPQEKVELSQEQQALLNYIVDAYNKHRIPPDQAKKLVCGSQLYGPKSVGYFPNASSLV